MSTIEDLSSSVTSDQNYQLDYVSSDYAGDITYNYTIYVPNSLYLSLTADGFDAQKIIKGQADLYNPVGLIYNIIFY